ncbi:MAG: ribbon-helix-helix protein, CopG family [Nitrospirota bacterium]
MKSTSLTVRLDEDLNRLLSQACRQLGKSRSTLVREALARYLRLIQFEALRKKTMQFAEARGYLLDEDLIRDIS